jgi:hypothetical protein
VCDVRPQHSKKQAKAATLNGLQYLIILIAIIKQKRLVDLFFLNAFVRVFGGLTSHTGQMYRSCVPSTVTQTNVTSVLV